MPTRKSRRARSVRQRQRDPVDLSVIALTNTIERPIGWISLLPDGSISVGLRDRTFIAAPIDARLDLWNADNRVTVEFLVPDAPDQLVMVRNPHLTFHPPIAFHLVANDSQELFAGIADLQIMLDEIPEVPWIRFVSRPAEEIKPSAGPRKPGRTQFISLPLTSTRCSVGVAVDFVQPGSRGPSGRPIDYFADCGANRIRVSCEPLAPQSPTLAWYHQH